MCFRDDINFLKLKNSLTQSISNRLVIRSDYYRSYKDLRQCYIYMMRANLMTKTPTHYQKFLLTTFDNKKFLSVLSKVNMHKDLDYALTWRASQVNALFNLATTARKKKKKLIFTHRTFYIKPQKRLFFVCKCICIFMRNLYVKGLPRHTGLIKGLENFLLAPDSLHVVNKFKLKIYKLYLFRIT